MSRLYCIDASIYIFAAWFGMPDRWFSAEGYPLNAVYGYLQFLRRVLRESQPQYVMAAFDESLGSGFRHRLYPEYKSNRVLPDEALAFQLRSCRELSERLGIACFADDEHEADDFIASAARAASRRGIAVTVVSRDKDLAQVLVGDGDQWWDFHGRRTLDRAGWERERGLRCDQLGDFLALAGDSVDAIPGVPGIGPVTATRLLQRFHSLDNLYADLQAVAASDLRGARGLADKLERHRDTVVLARQLVALRDDIRGLDDVDGMVWRGVSADTAEWLVELGLPAAQVQRWLAGLPAGEQA